MAEIIDTSRLPSGGQGVEEVQVVFNNVQVTNATDDSVKNLIIAGFGPVPKGSSVQIEKLEFAEITVESEDGDSIPMIARSEGESPIFSNQECSFTGPNFGTVELKGQQFGMAYFSPKF